MSGIDQVEEHRFHRQQWVVWNPDLPTRILIPSRDIREEPPYQVHEVRPVDSRCTCGVGDNNLPHHSQCGVYNRASVGHDQIVTIIADGEHHVLSGAWLAPLER